MPVTDPVADMLARLRNGHQALHADVEIPLSRMKADLARILKEEGFVEDYKVGEYTISIKLKYVDGRPLIAGARKVSTPGRRVYVGVNEIPRVRNGLGICVLSTSRGVMEGSRASSENVGGELLCEIW
ncbi:30S ribosomal protein S8 [Desulfohalovibrio reitneri]|jgi:small subunit ribosomal protein S8|uniref:30S ribosomal protein S8 n=1 Tax=Desulfohalovibrio reitneri TaxID=1307759 RepID=UPI0004A6C957|nr:30S ribosomal protein S8 [Desulfohalovibrio reitneri]